MVDVVEYFKNTPEAQRREDFAAAEVVKVARDAAKEKMQEAGAGCVKFGQRPLGRRCGVNVACVAFVGVVNSVTCPHFSEDKKCRKKCTLHAENNKYIAALQKYKAAQAAYDNFWDERLASRQK